MTIDSERVLPTQDNYLPVYQPDNAWSTGKYDEIEEPYETRYITYLFYAVIFIIFLVFLFIAFI